MAANTAIPPNTDAMITGMLWNAITVSEGVSASSNESNAHVASH